MRLKLEKIIECRMKGFVNKMIQPIEHRYQRCYYCSGYEYKKPCYVEPYVKECKR